MSSHRLSYLKALTECLTLVVQSDLVELAAGVLPALELVHQTLAQLVQADAVGQGLTVADQRKIIFKTIVVKDIECYKTISCYYSSFLSAPSDVVITNILLCFLIFHVQF